MRLSQSYPLTDVTTRTGRPVKSMEASSPQRPTRSEAAIRGVLARLPTEPTPPVVAHQDGFATSILSDGEFAECMTSAFAPSRLHVEPLLAKLKRAILSPKDSPLRNFTAVSSGSSVTAGEDSLSPLSPRTHTCNALGVRIRRSPAVVVVA